MCGIAGIVLSERHEIVNLHALAEAMSGTLYHRGPDANGVWVDPENLLALSHRRLSIQDLSRSGHQPMASGSGRFHIVFNGEIYNFKALSTELGHLGHHFRGHSDTEVLLAAMEEWGVFETLIRSRGMFAMAVVDKKERELILCRDRLGEKPLFFGWINSSFTFASELKALKRVFPGSLVVDENALAAYFRFGYVPTPFSIYKNIFKLMPGTFLRIPLSPFAGLRDFDPLPSSNAFSPQPYWDVGEVARQGLLDLVVDERQAVDQLDGILREVISQQRLADVPIGCFLSGGVDSSLVAAVMQAVSDRPIRSFTIGFSEKEFDEAPYARAVAHHIGSDHQEYYISAKDSLGLIEDLPTHWDEPFADSSQMPALLVAKMARQKVTVCLTGDGGDELFCGYNRYFACEKIMSMLQAVPLCLRKFIFKSINSIPSHLFQSSYLSYMKFINDNRTQARIGAKVHKFSNMMCMSSKYDAYRYLLSCWDRPEDILAYSREVPSILDRDPSPDLGSFIHDAMYWDQLGYLVDDNLVKGDRSSMAFSLEARSPLLDPRVVEFSWRLPLSTKYRRGESKWILRKVLDRYVPRTLIERPKMGFSVPVGDWLRGPLRSWAGDLMHSDCDMWGGDATNIQRVWQEHQNGEQDHSQKLWSLCMWLSWSRDN